jgi:hypothetical protein
MATRNGRNETDVLEDHRFLQISPGQSLLGAGVEPKKLSGIEGGKRKEKKNNQGRARSQDSFPTSTQTFPLPVDLSIVRLADLFPLRINRKEGYRVWIGRVGGVVGLVRTPARE